MVYLINVKDTQCMHMVYTADTQILLGIVKREDHKYSYDKPCYLVKHFEWTLTVYSNIKHFV